VRRFARFLIPCALFVLGLQASAAWAQGIPVEVDTLDTIGRSPYEDGYLSRFWLDRIPVGPRQAGMGGAGSALLGGSEYLSLNPAAIMGLTRFELTSELALLSGSAGVSDFPRILNVGGGDFLDTSNYRVSPRGESTYNSLTFGGPLVIFGGRGAFSLVYRRVARTGRMDETRVELVGPVTNNIESTYGLGDIPTEGKDAISAGIARAFGPVDVGLSLNWMSGKLVRNQDVGISTFGFVFLSASTAYEQDVSAFNVDLGARTELGKLSLSGSLYLGHTVDFSNGSSIVTPLPDPQNPTQQFLVRNSVLDQKLDVPTMFGFGAAYNIFDNLVVAADMFIRPWSNAKVERRELVPISGFTDPEDSTSFQFVLATTDGMETFSPKFGDTNSFAAGLEWTVGPQSVQVPLRIGFRSEKLTQNNVTIPEVYAQPSELIFEHWRNPDDPEIKQAVDDLLEHNILMFQGDPVSSFVIAFGAGVRIGSFGADIAVQSRSYDIKRFFLDDFDPLTNNLPPTSTSESRSLLDISLGARWSF
jgi:hypothetical protein